MLISISVTIVPLVTFSYFLKCSFLLLSFLNTWSIMFLVWSSDEVHNISPMILHMYASINFFVFSIYLITYVTSLHYCLSIISRVWPSMLIFLLVGIKISIAKDEKHHEFYDSVTVFWSFLTRPIFSYFLKKCSWLKLSNCNILQGILQ